MQCHETSRSLKKWFPKLKWFLILNQNSKTPTQVFFCECCEIFRNTYFEKHLQTSVFKIFSMLFSFIFSVMIYPDFMSTLTTLVKEWESIWWFSVYFEFIFSMPDSITKLALNFSFVASKWPFYRWME